MALAYTPPGVTVSEAIAPSAAPLLAVPASVCFVGQAQGFIQRTDPIALTNEDTIRLTNLPEGAILQSIVSVVNPNTGTAYAETTDYVVNYSSNVNEIQTVTLAGATGGTFTLSFRGEETGTIAYNAAAATVETALETLGTLENADVAVSGSAGGPYTVTFSGQYANTNVEALVADGALLTGTSPTVTVATPTEGGVTGTIRREADGDIEEGETVRVSYTYVPENYYQPTRLQDQSSIEEVFGPAFNSDGTIFSPVSFAAQIAFENGARDLVVQALFRRTTDGDPDSAPRVATDAEVQQTATWEHTLYALRDIEDINVVVPVIGQSFSGLSDSEQLAILQTVRSHIRFMADEQQYVIGIFGEDSSTSSSVGQKTVLRDHAEALRDADPSIAEQLVLVAPSKFERINPVTGQKFYVGGQYFAAGLAGMISTRPVSEPLTRRTVSGFTAVSDPRSKSDRIEDARVGLLVALQSSSTVQTRHAVTLDNTATQRRELSVVRAKHRMIESVRDTIDTQIIGKVIADGDAPGLVATVISGVLESLKFAGDLVDYSSPQARTLSLDPTTVEVRFSYRPAFPLNYVNIVFSIDLSGDEVTTVTAI